MHPEFWHLFRPFAMPCGWSASVTGFPAPARWRPAGWRCLRSEKWQDDCETGMTVLGRWRCATTGTASCRRVRTRGQRTSTSWSSQTIRPTFAHPTPRREHWELKAGSAMWPVPDRIDAIACAAIEDTPAGLWRSKPTASASLSGAARWPAKSAWNTGRSTPASESVLHYMYYFLRFSQE